MTGETLGYKYEIRRKEPWGFAYEVWRPSGRHLSGQPEFEIQDRNYPETSTFTTGHSFTIGNARRGIARLAKSDMKPAKSPRQGVVESGII